jgi:hypothetical protein
MAVLGSKGVGWKVSSFTKSEFWGEADAVSLDLRPVRESQLEYQLVWLCFRVYGLGTRHTCPCRGG